MFNAQLDHDRANRINRGAPPAEEPRAPAKGVEGRRRGFKRLKLHNQYVSGNRILNEAARPLSIDMLGKPGHAIVMRDGGNRKKKKNPPLAASDNAGSEPHANVAADIEADLDSQGETISLPQIMSNIGDLRPRDDKVLSQKEFNKLKRLLVNGFLATQLRKYLHWATTDVGRETLAADGDAPLMPPEYRWMRMKKSWSALSAEEAGAVGGVDAPLRNLPELALATAKEALVQDIMTEVWGLSVAEQQNRLGETLIELREREFVILMRKSSIRL